MHSLSFCRSHAGFSGGSDHFFHDSVDGGRREEIPPLHQHPERYQPFSVGLYYGCRPILRGHRQLEPARRIHAFRMVRGIK